VRTPRCRDARGRVGANARAGAARRREENALEKRRVSTQKRVLECEILDMKCLGAKIVDDG